MVSRGNRTTSAVSPAMPPACNIGMSGGIRLNYFYGRLIIYQQRNDEAWVKVRSGRSTALSHFTVCFFHDHDAVVAGMGVVIEAIAPPIPMSQIDIKSLGKETTDRRSC